MSPTFVMSLSTPRTTLLVFPSTFLFLFATSPVDLGEKKVVESFFAGANVAKAFEQTSVMPVLKIIERKMVKTRIGAGFTHCKRVKD